MQQQMEWSKLVDKLMLLQRRFDHGDISVTEFSAEFKGLMQKLAEEIKSNPYAKEVK